MSDWDKAVEAFKQFDKRISEKLRNERPRDVKDLLGLKKMEIDKVPGIIASYFPYPFWLYRFDPDEKRPLDVNINSYKFQRDKHIDDVLDLVRTILSFKTGSKTIDAIGATGSDLYIFPFWKFGQDHGYKNANPFFPSLGINATAMPWGDSDAAIQFTATMWGAPSSDPKTNIATGTSGFSGPSTGTDETLFHEMVHGLRHMAGVSNNQLKVDQGYVNEEEYIAIVISNIYLSEKGQRLFRADHSGFKVLHDPQRFIDNPQNVSLSPRALFKKVRHQQPKYFRDLARIPRRDAKFNPVRDYAEELNLVQP